LIAGSRRAIGFARYRGLGAKQQPRARPSIRLRCAFFLALRDSNFSSRVFFLMNMSLVDEGLKGGPTFGDVD
jgi:hypothetical protein